MSFPWVLDNVYANGSLVFSTELDIFQGISRSDDTLINESIIETGEQGPPSLHCNFNQIEDDIYEFWTIYDDSGQGNNPPDSEYGVRLHLIAPNGTALPYYSMSVHPDYLPDPDYSLSVKYNYTVNLSTLYDGEGLWHHYFTTKDAFNNDIFFMPKNGYCLGPLTTAGNPSILQYSTIQSTSDDWYNPVGFINSDIALKVGYFGGEEPENVYMCLIPAVIAEGTGSPDNTYGIKKFLMQPEEQTPDYSEPVEFIKTINFGNLGYETDEIGWFYHYFEVELDNGTRAYLYNYIDDENNLDLNYEYDASYIHVDIKGPLIVDDGPTLYNYNFYDRAFNMAFFTPGNPYGPRLPLQSLTTYSSYRFSVSYVDPDGYVPSEGYPRIIFKNKITGEEKSPIVMDEYQFDLLTLNNQYSCVVDGSFLGPGQWIFRIEGKNSQQVDSNTIYGTETFWVTGDPLKALDFFVYNSFGGGSIPLTLFTAAMLLASTNPDVTKTLAVGIVGLVAGIISNVVSMVLAFNSNDPYAFLGTGVAFIWNAIAILGSTTTPSKPDFSGSLNGLMNRFSLPVHAMQFFSLCLMVNSWGDSDGGILAQIPAFSSIVDLISLPFTIIINIGLAVVIRNILMKDPVELLFSTNKIPFQDTTKRAGDTDRATRIIKAMINIYGIFSAIMGIVSLLFFLRKSQAPINFSVLRYVN